VAEGLFVGDMEELRMPGGRRLSQVKIYSQEQKTKWRK